MFNKYFYQLIFKVIVFFALFLSPLNANEINRPKVSIVVDNAYPPYSYLKDDKLEGIYVEMVLLAAQELMPFYQIELIPMPWKRAIFEVELGHVMGVLPPYKHLEERPFITPYSEPLMIESVIAFCNKDIDINKYLDKKLKIPALNIGVNAGFLILGDKITNAAKLGSVKIWENKNTSANILKLLSKRIDCYINDKLSTLWQFKRMKQQNALLNFDDIQASMLIMEQQAYIGYAKGFSQLETKADFIKRMNLALIKLKNTGEVKEILNRYIK
ncbi:transporter substrate-binding domain-containing protein [Pseudoalteromonas sp. C2R02]|uniref:substrate-binding periplasmic protein n=1 Tax=Pseudoalteromonas sp. C2R02 TaxID=2841565 RepID=UPI001C0A51D6|nr:transporter substrate-binding domain-containing protein [Pseudoalteromonas sp. C2R02]